MRPQKLVLESCDLCLVRFADGSQGGRDNRRKFRKELVPCYDFTTVWHDDGRNEGKTRIKSPNGNSRARRTQGRGCLGIEGGC